MIYYKPQRILSGSHAEMILANAGFEESFKTAKQYDGEVILFGDEADSMQQKYSINCQIDDKNFLDAGFAVELLSQPRFFLRSWEGIWNQFLRLDDRVSRNDAPSIKADILSKLTYEQKLSVVKLAIRNEFKRGHAIIAGLSYHLGLRMNGLYYGIEPDGYTHT